jgi:hypothetical protein
MMNDGGQLERERESVCTASDLKLAGLLGHVTELSKT